MLPPGQAIIILSLNHCMIPLPGLLASLHPAVGVLVGWCALGITHLWPPLSLSVSSAWNALLRPLSLLIQVFTQMLPSQEAPWSRPSALLHTPHTHVLCISMTHLVCCLPPPTEWKLHEGGDCGLSWSGLCPLPTTAGLAPTGISTNFLAGWLAGWRNAVTSDSGFYASSEHPMRQGKGHSWFCVSCEFPRSVSGYMDPRHLFHLVIRI